MKDMIVNLLLRGDSSRMIAMLGKSESRLQRFSNTARHEFNRIKNVAHSLQSKLAGLGMGIGGMMLIKQSAQLDKSLTRIGQTADMSRINVMGLRKELFRMSRETGQSLENIKDGFDVAVQSGLKFREALPVTEAVNKATAVTNAKPDILTSSLTTAAAVFDFDLSKPGQALLLLDKMRVAGKLGKAEMENLASIFPRVGFGAKRAGMSFDQTLAFVEGLSQAESNPERLATLSASWLRLFTNQTYMKKSQNATGVKFFNAKGDRRDALEVFADIKSKYDLLKTDAKKHSFISNFLEGADTETITASVAFLGGNFLENARGFSREINVASGTLMKELPDAINNAVDQTGRLKAALRETADDFSLHLNAGITSAIQKLLNSKEKGGMNMSGKELIAAGATALGVGAIGYRMAGPPLKKLLGRLGGTGVGIAEGKAIEDATGVTPVFVTNMPASGLGSLPGDKTGGMADKATKALKMLAPAGAAAAGATALSVGGAVLTTTTAVRSLADALRGGSGANWINDAWERQKIAIERDVYNPIISMFTPPEAKLPMIYNEDYRKSPESKNNFTFNFQIDKNNRIIGQTSTPDADVRINIARGNFDIR